MRSQAQDVYTQLVCTILGPGPSRGRGGRSVGGGVNHTPKEGREGRAMVGGWGGFGMSSWCVVLICSWWRLLTDRYSLLPFPWTLSLHRRWCMVESQTFCVIHIIFKAPLFFVPFAQVVVWTFNHKEDQYFCVLCSVRIW